MRNKKNGEVVTNRIANIVSVLIGRCYYNPDVRNRNRITSPGRKPRKAVTFKLIYGARFRFPEEVRIIRTLVSGDHGLDSSRVSVGV